MDRNSIGRHCSTLALRLSIVLNTTLLILSVLTMYDGVVLQCCTKIQHRLAFMSTLKMPEPAMTKFFTILSRWPVLLICIGLTTLLLSVLNMLVALKSALGQIIVSSVMVLVNGGYLTMVIVARTMLKVAAYTMFKTAKKVKLVSKIPLVKKLIGEDCGDSETCKVSLDARITKVYLIIWRPVTMVALSLALIILSIIYLITNRKASRNQSNRSDREYKAVSTNDDS